MWTLPDLCSLSVAMIGEVSSQEKVSTTKGTITFFLHIKTIILEQFKIFFVVAVNLHRIERLWRDVWISVSSKYYNLLHSFEENGFLDISSTDDIFCVHYTFLQRLKKDLEIFTEGWNHHPLRTEGNRSPIQMWETGQMLNNSNVHSENLAVSVFSTFLDKKTP